MSKPMGRPLKGDYARKDGLTIRLSQYEKGKIAACAEILGLNKTDAILYCIEAELKRHKNSMSK